MDPFHPWTWNMLFIFSLSYLCAFSFLLLPSWGYMWTTSHLIMKASPFWKKSNYAWHPFLASKWKWRHIVVNCADILIAVSCWYSLATIFEGTKHSHWTVCIIFGRCIICLAEYEEKDVLRVLPYCGHDFHMACIDLWLEQNSTCPVCRISLVDNPDSEHTAPPPLPSVAAISPPSCPESSRSDPCRCLFVSTGHSSRASEAPRHEPDQENQVASAPSVDGANNMPLSEVDPTPENNSQTLRKQVDRSTQLGPCK